ncbi:MAG: S-methyl-5-thioribose-1-phosphate isomerase [Candidatus Lokiarchaeota archaeon]|nr:S-methyl-5-thioribose-1-phosphate isomerase [Candidatus Lokiarchaeota archaeon]
MKQLLEDAEKIKSLEIQGATNVALNAIDFLNNYAQRLQEKTIDSCIESLHKAKNVLIDTRPTEPAMKNGLNFIVHKLEREKHNCSLKDIPEIIEGYKNEYYEMLQDSKRKIAEIGARRIPNAIKKFVVMTHCHSSLVTAILLEAKKQDKNFKVINTETQPRLQGRITAQKLSEANIEVMHVVDSAMRWAVRHFQVDLILIGADSITSEGTIINKIGSRLLALVAHEEHVPFYVASPLLKYNPETNLGILETIEMRDPNEVWESPPKNINVLNPAFETVSRRYIDGLITEAGIFASSHISNYFAKLYPEIIE